MKFGIASFWLVPAMVAAPSAAQLEFTTEYGTEYTTIGDPGNRNTTPSEGNPIFKDVHRPIGSVDYEYRIARTEVTLGQYFDFVQAYLPVYIEQTGNAFADPEFVGVGIQAGSVGGTFIRDGFSPDRAARMSWEYAARYVNWLHNDKGTEVSDFETGVYDTSTFTQNTDGSFNHQLTRDSDARFWIPTQDEWIKAAYWDPTKNGGEGGYWLYPNGSDSESIPGLLPINGGQRNAGPDEAGFPLDVGAFVDVQSPWGLFDLTGGESEWTEAAFDDAGPQRRLTLGTNFGNTSYLDPFFPADIVGSGFVRDVTFSGIGLRLAAAVPAPGACSVLFLVSVLVSRRKRSCTREASNHYLPSE